VDPERDGGIPKKGARRGREILVPWGGVTVCLLTREYRKVSGGPRSTTISSSSPPLPWCSAMISLMEVPAPDGGEWSPTREVAGGSRLR